MLLIGINMLNNSLIEPIYRNLGAGMLGGGLVGANIGSLLTPQGQTMSGMYPALGALGGLL